MTAPRGKNGKEESDAILRRLDQQSEKLLGGGGTGVESQETSDPAEVWGKRIGRGLGIVFVIYLIWHLLTTYVFK